MVVAKRFQQLERAHHVGLDEFARGIDGAVDMRLRREIDDGRRPVLVHEVLDQGAVLNAAVNENMIGMIHHGCQRIQIPGIGQGVQVDDPDVSPVDQAKNEIASDKTGAAGD